MITSTHRGESSPGEAGYAGAMRHALSLAMRGPVIGGNPQVGCVILDAGGAILAEGWHRGAGTPHAEIDALSTLTGMGLVDADGRLPAGMTAVVTLEPCNHTGRTGPCALALIDAGMAKVVYSVEDPGRDSSGGAKRMLAAGVAVEAGLLHDEVEAAILPWLTSARRGRPWVIAKWASTLDGRAAAADGSSKWITGTASRQRVHEQRANSDAILVGTSTVLSDDPSLTARGDGGELLSHQPVPVVVGQRAVPATAKLKQHPAGLIETGTRDLAAVLSDLDSRGIRRVFIEGGPTIESAFVAAGLVDEYLIYLAPALLGGPRLAVTDIGIDSMADIRRLQITGIEQLGDDILVTARPRKEN